MTNCRIGFGYDVHQLAVGLPLYLGGIRLEHSKGCVAHSDGDVLIHALCDALLGAAALRDIGYHFPDTDKAYKNIDSKILLKNTCQLLVSNGYTFVNADCTVCLQQPRLKEIIPEMLKTLAQVMETSAKNISVKATTTEKLGFVGSEQGISAYVVVLIEKTQE